MPIPGDYPGMTNSQLDSYISDFLAAIYGEEVRDKFARIAYLIGHQIPDSVEPSVQAAAASAAEAAEKAENAARSASSAARSANSAYGSMQNASQSATNAANSATAAKTAQTAAQEAAENAASSENSAAGSANSAYGSMQNASQSATNAANSATAAKTAQTAAEAAQESAEEAQQALEQLLGSVTTIWYGQCNTAANTAAKVVSCQGFNLATGALIAVKFTNENTANYPTLNVNSTGAKSIYGHSNYPPVGTGTGVWKRNEVKLFVYDGTYFRIVGTSALELCGGAVVPIANGGTGVSNTSRLSFYGTCSTAANTAAKVVSCPDFSLAAGVRVAVKFTDSNTAANVTLNVNSTGAKNVYLYGTMRWTGTPWQAQEIVEFIYDGTNYQMLGKSHLAS